MRLPFQPFTGPQHAPLRLNSDTPGAALLIHGFPGTPLEMNASAQALHLAGWSVSAPLLPGFGAEIEHLPEKKMEDWLKSLQTEWQLLQRERQRPLILVGNSMGGALAQMLAAQSPPDLLILFAPFWKIPGGLWASLPWLKRILPEIQPFRAIKPDYRNPQFRRGLQEFLPGVDPDSPEVRRQIENFRLPLGMFDEIRRVGQGGQAAIPQISCPTLIFQGRQDPLVRPSLTRASLSRYQCPLTYVQIDGGHDLYDPARPSWPQVRQTLLAAAEETRRGAAIRARMM